MKQQAIVFTAHSDKRVSEILARAGMENVKRGSSFLCFTPEEAARAPLGETRKGKTHAATPTGLDSILAMMGG